MKQRFGSSGKLRLLAIVMSVMALVMVVGVAYAITIVVDGDRESAWAGGGGQTPGSVTDPDEPAILDNVDIHFFSWTNDQTDMYFLVDVLTSPLMPPLAPIDICLDTDKSGATDIPAGNTIQRDRCGYGSGVTGIDTVIEAYISANGVTKNVDIFDVSVNPRAYIGSGTLGYNKPAAADPMVEIAAPLSLLGFSNANCPSGVPMVVYYDGGDTNPDDNLPDTGSTTISCGGPTAITLNNLEATAGAQNNTAALILAATVVAALGLAGVALRRRTA